MSHMPHTPQEVPVIGVQAHDSAAISDVVALRELAAKYDEAAVDTKLGRLEAANVGLQIFQWCDNHGLASK